MRLQDTVIHRRLISPFIKQKIYHTQVLETGCDYATDLHSLRRRYNSRDNYFSWQKKTVCVEQGWDEIEHSVAFFRCNGCVDFLGLSNTFSPCFTHKVWCCCSVAYFL